jgi:hypothetical protein
MTTRKKRHREARSVLQYNDGVIEDALVDNVTFRSS